jgi:hypothetical protein
LCRVQRHGRQNSAQGGDRGREIGMPSLAAVNREGMGGAQGVLPVWSPRAAVGAVYRMEVRRKCPQLGTDIRS